jgi:predicted molibdopterin-dependent oxidoreductase YjgC
MFRRLPNLAGPTVGIKVDGRSVSARADETVASALLAAGVKACRTTAVSQTPRGPYCMMGVCFDCLVTVDGVGNRQGCLTVVQDGMVVETQRGARAIAQELGGPA